MQPGGCFDSCPCIKGSDIVMPDMGPAVDDLLDDVFNVAATSQSTESVSVPPDIGQDPPLIPDRVLLL